MKLNQLQAFVAIADTLDYQKAADRVFATKVGVYEAARSLTRQLGVRLIEPKTGGSRAPLVLTKAGEHLAQNARLILDTASLTSNLISKVYDKDGNVNYGSSYLAAQAQPGFDNEAAGYASL